MIKVQHLTKSSGHIKAAVITAGGVALLAIFFTGSNIPDTATNQTAQVAQSILRFQENSQAEIIKYTIEPGDTFTTVMESFGIPYEESESMVDISENVYDFTIIKAGQLLRLIFVQDAFAAVEYTIDEKRVVIIEKQGNDFEARQENITYDVEQVVAEVIITNSLFVDASEAGLEDKTIMELADIFGWDIDFTTDIQEGDAFKIIYGRRFGEGTKMVPDRILAARFKNQETTYWAFFYEDPDGNRGYYNREGRLLARQFLKSPLSYSRISSGFSYSRINPVTKKVQPHRAIDYAAPKGTPITTTGAGEITYAGWNGDHGIYVEVKHNGIYTTKYSHLSKIAHGIKKGDRVQQGQTIGYVGSTGISTGPHLQYAMVKNGSSVNPLTIELPPGESIQEEWMEDFNTIKNQFRTLIE